MDNDRPKRERIKQVSNEFVNIRKEIDKLIMDCKREGLGKGRLSAVLRAARQFSRTVSTQLERHTLSEPIAESIE